VKQAEKATKHHFSAVARSCCALGLLLTFALLLATPASASYEQVATFGNTGPGGELNGVAGAGIAVNVSGAGGVPAGTVYAANAKGARILRYSAKGEFREAWGWGVAAPDEGKSEPSNEFQRCGPDGEAAHPTCYNGNIESGDSGNGIGQLFEPQGIAVDQSTGNVYVYNSRRSSNVIQVFNADGSKLLASFGEFAQTASGMGGGTFEENPDKLHSGSQYNIGVDDSGSVYVYDYTLLEAAGESRVMVFKPQSPGDYEHYVYAGRANDIAVSHDKVNYHPSEPALDSAGNLYTTNEEKIFEFAAGEPKAPSCEYQAPGGGISAFAVNPGTGEVFYYSDKNKKIHRLSSCDSQGKFAETEAFAAAAGALTFNPSLSYEGRPPGVLYGVGVIYASAEVRLPVIESESVSSVTSSTAVLGAQINPKGSNTAYIFQYITNDAYEANEPADRFAGASQAPIGGANLGSGQGSLGAATALVGLVPDTEYRYRVVATSHCEPAEEKTCEATGATQVFRTFPAEAPVLPDGRAYELVSPALKNGGEVIPPEAYFGSCGGVCTPATLGTTFPMQSSPDGDAVVYEGFPFSFTEGARKFNEYLAKRGPSGWQTTNLSPLLQGGNEGEGPTAFNADLTRGVLRQGSFSPVLSPEAPAEYDNLYTQSTASPSMLSALLQSGSPNRHAKLTYAGASADLSHIFFEANDALTGQTSFAPEAVDGGVEKNNLYESVNGELSLVNVLPGNAETVPGTSFGLRQASAQSLQKAALSHVISEDGSRVFWSDESGQVYVRERGETTRAIPDSGQFLAASADGSKLLLGDGHLYDLETEAIVDLTAGEGGFEGIAGQSEDLSRIFFVDTEVLTEEEENDHGEKAQAGGKNLYSWHEGVTSFVGTLLAGDDSTGNPSGTAGDWHQSPSQRTAEASPDGRWLSFVSQAPLTGYDNTCTTFDLNVQEEVNYRCAEVFLYDSATGALTCASCNPTGARPLGGSTLRLISFAPPYLPQPRYLTDSGRLYFDSRDSLSAFDTNNGVADVYQYEPEGIGSCKRGAGCVSLISSGHEPTDSAFFSVDTTGKNVFFTTRDQLVLKDRDDAIDLYVAREGGGVGAETETSRGECQGEACQAAVVPPNDPTPGSSSFEGTGNVNEKPASKRHKKHKKKHKSHRRSHGRANQNRGGAK